MSRAVVAGLAAVCVAACGESIFADPEYPAYTRVEVWNRTTEDVFILTSDRMNTFPPDPARIDVPACGHVVVERAAVNRLEFRTARGYIGTRGDAGHPDGSSPRPLFLAVQAFDSIQELEAPPDPLAECGGLPQVQEGF